MMTKFAERVLISGAAELALLSAVGGVTPIGEAHAGPTLCVNATNLCQPAMTNGPLRSYTLICQPTGAKGGASCHEATRR